MTGEDRHSFSSWVKSPFPSCFFYADLCVVVVVGVTYWGRKERGAIAQIGGIREGLVAKESIGESPPTTSVPPPVLKL